MRAIVFDQHSPDLNAYRLASDMPEPLPGPDEVIVRVAYAALNRLDNFVRIGWKGLDLKLPHIPCSDFKRVRGKFDRIDRRMGESLCGENRETGRSRAKIKYTSNVRGIVDQ